MQMDAGMDTGDIIVQKAMPIGEEDRFAQVHDKMAELGGDALLEALTQLENGTAIKTPQDNTLASHAPIIKKSDGEITWNETSEEILNKIRAFDPWPGCYTMYNGQLLKIWKAEKLKSFAEGGKGLTFKTKNGAILVTELQAQGKKRMPAADFLRGQKN
jgi:methionyl-tRNA formyltransferase